MKRKISEKIEEVQDAANEKYENIKTKVFTPKKNEKINLRIYTKLGNIRSEKDIVGMPRFNVDQASQSQSLLCNLMTEELFDLYQGKTDENGNTFEKCILDGCINLNSNVGIHALCHDSYYSFGKIFDVIVNDYHSYGECGHHVTNFNVEDFQPILSESEQALVLQTILRMDRNFEICPMLSSPIFGIPLAQMNKIEKSAKKVIETFENGKYYSLGTTEDHYQLLELRD